MGSRAFGYIADVNDPDPPVLGQLLDEPAVVIMLSSLNLRTKLNITNSWLVDDNKGV